MASSEEYEGEDLHRDDGEREGPGFSAKILNESLETLPHRTPLTLSPDASATDAIRAMHGEHRGLVLVTEDGTAQSRVVGIFTDRDVMDKIVDRGRNPMTIPLSEVMTPDPDCLRPDATIAWVLNRMAVGGFRHVPIVDENHRPLFVVSVRDVVEFLVEFFPREVLNLPPEPEYAAPRSLSREGA